MVRISQQPKQYNTVKAKSIDFTSLQKNSHAKSADAQAFNAPSAEITKSTILAQPKGLTGNQDYKAHELIVKFKAGVQTAQVNNLYASLGVVSAESSFIEGMEFWNLGNKAVQEAILTLKNNPIIEYAEPNYRLYSAETTSDKPIAIPNDDYYEELWGLHNTGQTGGYNDADIDAPAAWKTARGTGVVVGVIDSGIDPNHPDLQNNLWTNPGEIPNDGIDNDGNGYIDDYYGYDFVNEDENPFDDNGHGTHVAGTIAAEANNNTGIIGVAPEAKIMSLKFLSSDGSGFTTDAIRAIDYAVMMGADITNNSWGGGGYSYALYDAIENAEKAGQLFVAAAGNGGQDGIGDNNDFYPSYPASYDLDNIISVAATDDRDSLSLFSNYGPNSVDIAAPGDEILSTLPGGYDYFSGTSMAAPHVTGVASLILSQNPNLTSDEVKNALLSSVDPISSLQNITVSGGRLNAYQALIDSQPQTNNFSFETGNFTDWKTYGNTEVISSSIGISPTDGQYQAQITTGNKSLSVAQIESLLGLDIGLLQSSQLGNTREGSVIQLKPLEMKAGDSILFDWNFLTNESPSTFSNNDFAFVSLNGSAVSLLSDKTESQQSFDPLIFTSQTGYNTTRIDFLQNGVYAMVIGVMDEGDTGVDSGLLIDNIRLLQSSKDQGIVSHNMDENYDSLLTGGLANQDLMVSTSEPTSNSTVECFGVDHIRVSLFEESPALWSLGQMTSSKAKQTLISDMSEPSIISMEELLARVHPDFATNVDTQL